MRSKALRSVAMLTKEGRELSAANLKKLSDANDHLKTMMDRGEQMKAIFQTLLPDEAELEAEDVDDPNTDGVDETETAGKSTSAATAAKEITEPDTSHSAEVKTVDSIIDLLRRKAS